MSEPRRLTCPRCDRLIAYVTRHGITLARKDVVILHRPDRGELLLVCPHCAPPSPIDGTVESRAALVESA